MFHTIKQGTLEYLTADALEGSVHCFSTRLGGVSEGQLSSLNLGTHRGDKPENVRENYRILGKAVGFAPEETVFTRQEHTDRLLEGEELQKWLDDHADEYEIEETEEEDT